jgi:hypothetical protein
MNLFPKYMGDGNSKIVLGFWDMLGSDFLNKNPQNQFFVGNGKTVMLLLPYFLRSNSSCLNDSPIIIYYLQKRKRKKSRNLFPYFLRRNSSPIRLYNTPSVKKKKTNPDFRVQHLTVRLI